MKTALLATLDFESLLTSKKKGIQRKVQIAETAIQILFKHGQIGFSYDQIAEAGRFQRPLIYTYFPKMNDLMSFCSGLIRYRYQVFVINKISEIEMHQSHLDAYADAALSWQDVYPKDVAVWLLFYHNCGVDTHIANFNRGLVDMGTQRIAAILEGSIYKKQSHLLPKDCMDVARCIQILITGGVVSRASENRTKQQWDKEKEIIIKTILALGKGPR